MANSIATGVAYADPEFVSVQVGNSTVPVAVTTSGIINGAYATTSAASGDTRLTYQRLTFSSTGSGETIRAFSVVTGAGAATGGTINGAHLSLSVNGAGTISGAGNALRATLGGTSTNPGGTLAAIQSDSNFASGGTWTNTSFIRFTNSGTGTVPNLFNIPAALFVTSTATIAKTLKVVASDGTPYYLMCSSAA
jgi:hypothetical protein